LRALAEAGSGADIVSGGELFRALNAGIHPKKIVFAGVGKTEAEIEEAVRAGILFFNVESGDELRVIQETAARLNATAAVSLRVNPDVEAVTHRHIATGQGRHKFGVPLEDAFENYRLAASLSHLQIRGVHVHLGSQITSAKPFEAAIRRIFELIDGLASTGINIEYFDIGGGAGIRYSKDDRELKPEKLATIVKRLWKKRPLKLILEPGRSIVASAGILVTRALYRKNQFLVVDAGMNDFIRPALYDAFHEILSVQQTARKKREMDIVGPVCETADCFARKRKISETHPGELLAVLNTGAYGSSMSSQYNSRLRAAEVLVDGDNYELITARETYADLIRSER
jgi:diaminopimelate decarboxylase